jgi:hypothetical protein
MFTQNFLLGYNPANTVAETAAALFHWLFCEAFSYGGIPRCP